MPAILLAHAALLAWVASDRAATIFPRASTHTALLDFPLLSPTTPVAQKPMVPIVRAPAAIVIPAVSVPVMPIPILVSTTSTEVAAEPSVAGSCDLTDTVQAAIRESVEARAALQILPQGARSVANAVMIWDGKWVAGPTPISQEALSRIRNVIQATLSGATVDCRQSVQAGPRLVTVPGAPDMVLAFGSGHWRWGDLAPQPFQVVSADSGAMTTNQITGPADPRLSIR